MSILVELFHVILAGPEALVTVTGAVPVIVNTSDETAAYPTESDMAFGPEMSGGTTGLTVKVKVWFALPAALLAVSTTG